VRSSELSQVMQEKRTNQNKHRRRCNMDTLSQTRHRRFWSRKVLLFYFMPSVKTTQDSLDKKRILIISNVFWIRDMMSDQKARVPLSILSTMLESVIDKPSLGIFVLFLFFGSRTNRSAVHSLFLCSPRTFCSLLSRILRCVFSRVWSGQVRGI